MPTFKPDFFGCRYDARGFTRAQIAVEAEIQSTLFSEHTSEQLVTMQEFIEHQRARRIKVTGLLLIPRGQQVARFARSLLDTLFPEGTSISIIQL